MDNNQLSIFAELKGVGAASGLILKQQLLYIIGDNSAFLYQYDLMKKKLDKIKILPDLILAENIPKKDKLDFEALCEHENTVYLLGSGSTTKRNLMVAYHLETQKVLQKDLSILYGKLKKKFLIDDDNLNIEGAIFNGKEWYLFNRGNGNAKKNGIFKLGGPDLNHPIQLAFTSMVLLQTNEVVVSFTDAILHHDQIYFLAAAEDTKSTYEDGEIKGSYLGCIDAKTLQLDFIKQISTNKKLEGITFYKENANHLEFLVCEDRDSDILTTVIYKLVV